MARVIQMTTTTPRRSAKACAALAGQVDRLAGLREQMKALTDEERALTAQVKSAMQTYGFVSVPGERAIAVLDTRTALVPDPARFVAAAGEAGVAALRVDVTAARRILPEPQLRALSAENVSHILRVQPIRPAAGGAA